MPKKKQVRYSAVFEIDSAIIKLKMLLASKEKKAKSEELLVVEDMKKSHDIPEQEKYWIEQANIHRKKAERFRKNINGIFEVRIPSLGKSRVALQTKPMSFLGSDIAVVEAK